MSDPPAPVTRRHLVLVALVLAVGLGLRLWAIDWGRPRLDLNPDELLILDVVRGMSLDDPDPDFYSYSGLTFHLDFYAGALLQALGAEIDDFDRLLIQRYWSVLWGTLAILVVWAAARELWGTPSAGALAAAALAITPLHVWDSHFGTTDVGLTLWVTLAIWLALRARRRPSAGRFALAGLAVGLAVAVKFNGLLAAAAVASAAVAARLGGPDGGGPDGAEPGLQSWMQVVTRGLVAGGTALAAFAAASPYSLLNLRDTLAAFAYESGHVSEGHFGFDVLAAGWQYRRGVYQLVAALPFGFGFALYAVVLGGLVALVVGAMRGDARRRGRAAVVLAFPAVYFAVFASYPFTPIRYYLPLYPVLLVVAAGLLDRWWAGEGTLLRRDSGEGGGGGEGEADRADGKARPGRGQRWRRWEPWAVLAVFAYTTAFTLTSTHRFTEETRMVAAGWADRELTPGARVVYVEPIYELAYMPLLDPQRFELSRAGIRQLDGIVADLAAAPVGYVCLSSLTYNRFYREGRPEMVRAWERIRDNPDHFRPVRTFAGWYLNKRWYRALDPMFDGYFVSPTIELYRYVGPRRHGPR